MKYPLRGPSPPQSGASHHRARSAALVASIQSGSEPTVAHPFGANQCHRPSSPIELNPSLSLPILDMYLLPWKEKGHLRSVSSSSFNPHLVSRCREDGEPGARGESRGRCWPPSSPSPRTLTLLHGTRWRSLGLHLVANPALFHWKSLASPMQRHKCKLQACSVLGSK